MSLHWHHFSCDLHAGRGRKAVAIENQQLSPGIKIQKLYDVDISCMSDIQCVYEAQHETVGC